MLFAATCVHKMNGRPLPMDQMQNQEVAVTTTPYQLKELSPKHRQVVSLVVQGTPRDVIADAVGFTVEYISWLLRQPIVAAEFKALEEIANTHLLALAGKRTEVIADVLETGSNEDRLKAAKLQMEATGLIGRQRDREGGPIPEGRLESLAERLVSLLTDKRERSRDERIIDVEQIP